MSNNSFFDEQTEQSKIKAEIVSKYFWAWANVIIATLKKNPRNPQKIAYIDLFAGPGRYKDGSKSTPLMILEQAIEHPNMREMLVSIFNDKDSDNQRSLQHEIESLKGIELLRYKPKINNHSVGKEIVQLFEGMKLVPSLFFVDPWGYKGLSLRLVNSVLKDWGCDCVFFFNYNRINMGLSNEYVKEHMIALFGDERYSQIHPCLTNLTPPERELTIVEELTRSLMSMGGKFVLPFRFKNEQDTRTSHHLFFVCKHFRGYEIMKGIMAGMSSDNMDGVPSFEYHQPSPQLPLLFSYSRALTDLHDMLLDRFSGQSLTMREIYENHSVGTPYIEKNYKEVLNKLEEEGHITADPPAQKRRMMKGVRTFAGTTRATFRGKGK